MEHVKKIVVIGPESTGKSTLSAALAETLHTVWVKEYARAYIMKLNRPYDEGDLLAIAQGQVALEEEMNSQAHQFLICDTDLYVTKVWSEHKYNRVHQWILEEIARREYHLYLLTDIDMPWEHDAQREYPDIQMRQYFYNIYKDIVQHSGVPWAIISGSPDERVSQALKIISSTFK